ncbi:MAG TPA: trehalose-phosphatase [Beijerinckiaceae bacterium]|jgi:trehalose 6-phosphate phosphatase|nr:trehalose-phosphatase [Microvirga sp.]HZB37428.1 trehalose-phosphatase [Beijerinckiaceae bacterium]
MPAKGDCALFLDFDGTLVEIAERPEAVVVAPGLPNTLATLRDQLGGALALVSGRSIGTLDGFFGPHRFDAAGLHGVEHRLRGELAPCRPTDHPKLRALIEALPTRLPLHPGVLIEDKGCSVGLHWRLAPEYEEELTKLVQEMAAGLGSEYRLQLGKAVAEILPAHASKGGIIDYFLHQPPFAERTAVFIGDDLTDELGFATVNGRDGVSIRVGKGPTIAQRRIETPAELRRCLSEWASKGRIDVERLSPA